MPEPLLLPGVRSSTLLGYLKGLGLLSILARQDDARTRAAWSEDGFVLYTERDLASLEAFFLERWSPAPVVSPWNGGSGFYLKDNTEAFERIERSDDPRLAPFNAAITAARAAIAVCGLTAKPEPKLEKPTLLRTLRATLPDDALEWLDAAVVLVDGEPRYPPVLGSGGNDGRYDVANNYAQAVTSVLGLHEADARRSRLRNALVGAPADLHAMSLAHLTRDASPVNSPNGEADALGNPWDLVFAVTGAMVFAAGVTRRLGVGGAAAAPFTLRPTGTGYGSAVRGEKGRDELWLPTWSRPATLAEVRALLREGRIQLQRRDAASALDAARAAGELGVARGISGFERFAILERAGQSNLSVPAGQIKVQANPAAEALATLDPWLGRMLARAAGDLPAAQRTALRALEQRAFDLARTGTPQAAAALVSAIGDVEIACAVGRVEAVRPLRASAVPWWSLLISDGTDPELRLAAAFASLRTRGENGQALRAPLVGKAREYAVAEGWSAPRAAPIVTQLAAVHERWSLAPEQDLAFGLAAQVGDLQRLAQRELDERRLASLLRGLVVLDWHDVAGEPLLTRTVVNPPLALLLLAFHDPRRVDVPVSPRPEWVARLRAGQARDVLAEAHLRLRLGGLSPIATATDLAETPALHGDRVAAALLPRPAARDLHALIRSLTTYDPAEDDVAP
ncbi:MAG TPA: type I-U CRISPR-associated protein Csx17 [Solirubrobacter sp.]|nr:type I-U CRISPR-associated protein Csx17 [Solirubrobacter sp.]